MTVTHSMDSTGAKQKMPENDQDHDPGAEHHDPEHYVPEHLDDEHDDKRTESISITVADSAYAESEKNLNDLTYRATDVPHWKEALFLGFQVKILRNFLAIMSRCRILSHIS